MSRSGQVADFSSFHWSCLWEEVRGGSVIEVDAEFSLSLLQYEWGQSSRLAPSLGLNVDRRILGPTLPTVRA